MSIPSNYYPEDVGGSPPNTGPEGAAVRAPAGPEVSSLTRMLRAIGAAALLASASSFLLQRWDGGGDLYRYFTLLAHPALVAVLGVLCGTRGRDPKSARTFLALGAAFVPALACILGGLLYSVWAPAGAAVPSSQYAVWVAPNGMSAFGALIATLVVAAPVVGFAFMALTRTHAVPLSIAYLAANALLLIPTRDPNTVALLAAAALGGLAWWEWKSLSREAALRTLEGVFVRLMIASPAVILLVRNALHYHLSDLFFALAWGAVALGLLVAAAVPRTPRQLGGLMRISALTSLFGGAYYFASALHDAGLPSTYGLPSVVLTFAIGCVALLPFAGDAAWRSIFRRTATIVALSGLMLDLVDSPDVVTSTLCFVVSIITLSIGYLDERRGLLLAGISGVAFALAFHVKYAIDLYAYTRWGSLALIGVVVILAAGYLDRNGEAIKLRLRQFHRRDADPAADGEAGPVNGPHGGGRTLLERANQAQGGTA